MRDSDRFRGCLLGLAAGDAVGTTVEFKPRGSFPPVTDMVGGGRFHLLPGQWTDDTSMALCLASSLAETGRFDPADQMNRYCDWWDHGTWSSTGRCFDIGATTADALRRFRSTGDPFAGSIDPSLAGNGCIMRLAPVPIFCFPNLEETLLRSEESARTTHGSVECLEAARLLGEVLHRLFSGRSKAEALFEPFSTSFTSPLLREIATGAYRNKSETEIHGKGYVVASLEAALWCFQTTDGFEPAILRAANLGDDADTTAAICGQVAGAFYGEGGIPRRWIDRLARHDEIRDLADRLRPGG